MKIITKSLLRVRLLMDYGINVDTTQITLFATKKLPMKMMIVDGIGGYALFRYGYDLNGEVKLYPNRMHSIHIDYFNNKK